MDTVRILRETPMIKSTLKLSTALALFIAASAASADTYGPFPVTVKGYEGDKTNSVSYSGQIARHALHDSLKKAAGKGDGGANAAEVEAMLLAYFNGSEADLEIMAPVSKDGYPVKQATVNAISSGKNISGKFYDGAMPAWPGGVSGKEAMIHMIKHAAQSNGGFDAENGFDWGQIISKYTMGAMMFNQVGRQLPRRETGRRRTNLTTSLTKTVPTTPVKSIRGTKAFGYWGGTGTHSWSLTPRAGLCHCETVKIWPQRMPMATVLLT